MVNLMKKKNKTEANTMLNQLERRKNNNNTLRLRFVSSPTSTSMFAVRGIVGQSELKRDKDRTLGWLATILLIL